MTPFIDRATFCTRPIIRRLRLVILAAVVMIAACGNPISIQFANDKVLAKQSQFQRR